MLILRNETDDAYLVRDIDGLVMCMAKNPVWVMLSRDIELMPGRWRIAVDGGTYADDVWLKFSTRKWATPLRVIGGEVWQVCGEEIKVGPVAVIIDGTVCPSVWTVEVCRAVLPSLATECVVL